MGPLTVTPKKFFTFCYAKSVMILPMLEKLKQSSAFGLIITIVNIDLFKKENRMWHVSVFIRTMFKIWETHKQHKEMETFWQHKLKTFNPLGLNEKEQYLF